MKKYPLLWIIIPMLIVGIGSCTRRNDSGGENNCISRYSPSSEPLVTTGQLDTIKQYFQKNNLSTTGLQFTSAAAITIPGPAYNGITYLVGAQLWINGLRVPSSNIQYQFDSTGTLLNSVGAYTGQIPDNDTAGHQSLTSLRQQFLNNYKQCFISGGCMNCGTTRPTASYQDTCLTAELVYLDASIQNNNTPSGKQLVKGWMVFPADNENFPLVYVIDGTGQAIPFGIYLP